MSDESELEEARKVRARLVERITTLQRDLLAYKNNKNHPKVKGHVEELMDLQARMRGTKEKIRLLSKNNHDGLVNRLSAVESSLELLHRKLDIWFGGINDPPPSPEEVKELSGE